MVTTVWYVPGWMRSQEPQDGVMPALARAFPGSDLEFRPWDGDRAVWPTAVDNSESVVADLVSELAAMPAAKRENLFIVGHSLGARITARVLARLAGRGMRVRQAALLAAAIPNSDPDLALAGGGSELPVLVVCNPADITLRYVYAIFGGESSVALGANGTLEPVANVIEYVVPGDITERVEIDRAWARLRPVKEICNHHAVFYIEYLGGILNGRAECDRVMVPQHLPTIEHRVVDAGIWWNVIDEVRGWKLERHKLTRHFRIISPDRRCVAWGGRDEMTAAFRKVRRTAAS